MPAVGSSEPTEDPLSSPMFSLEFQGVISGWFSECSGLGSETEVITQYVTGDKGMQIIKRIPGNMKYEDITLKRGVTPSLDIWDWRQQVEDGKVGEARKNGAITMYNQRLEPVAQWTFENAWPVKVSGPQLSAGSNEVALEELRITHEGMHRVKI